ncbi:MAG: restriction endonuclease [candidate division FCPU426 bacterium]
MGIPNPEIIARWVENDCRQNNFLPLKEVLIGCLTERLKGKSPEEIAEISERSEEMVSEMLQGIAAEYQQDGILPSFEISPEADSNYYKALPIPEIGFLKKLRAISPEGFEVFCKKILKHFNADATVQGGSNDGGVDFFSIGLPLNSTLEPMPPPARGIVIGQSKRYGQKNNVGESEIRTFVGGAIRKSDELRKNFPERVGIMTPTILAFWTTSDFAGPARKYAREMGVWYLSGIGLAQFAIRLGFTENQINEAEEESERIRHASKKIRPEANPLDRTIEEPGENNFINTPSTTVASEISEKGADKTVDPVHEIPLV